MKRISPQSLRPGQQVTVQITGMVRMIGPAGECNLQLPDGSVWGPFFPRSAQFFEVPPDRLCADCRRDGEPRCGCPDAEPVPGACGDPKCYVLHADPVNPIHPPDYVDSREIR